MTQSFFITATGTDIGKTYITTALIRAAVKKGLRTQALKPIVSGFDDNNSVGSDAGLLLASMGLPITPDSLDSIAPWRFHAPLAPPMAAEKEGKSGVDFKKLSSFCTTPRDADILLIEGVGGVMAPITHQHTVLDWMKALHIPAILIAGHYVGTLSHTLTACHALREASIPLTAVILNESTSSAATLKDTQKALEVFIKDIPILTSRKNHKEDIEKIFKTIFN